MSSGLEKGSAAAERLSALADGEVDAAAARAACAAWKTDAELRRTWHAWHLIGDVLRSEDLASSAERDQHFLLALRGRLALEPVVLAPEARPGGAAHPAPCRRPLAVLGVAAAPAAALARWLLPRRSPPASPSWSALSVVLGRPAPGSRADAGQRRADGGRVADRPGFGARARGAGAGGCGQRQDDP
jgi:negative regulator of sigma E activity